MSVSLSLAPMSHVFNDYPYERSTTLRTSSSSSTGTVKHYGCRQASGGSLPLQRTELPNSNTIPVQDQFTGARVSYSSNRLAKKKSKAELPKTDLQNPSKSHWQEGEAQKSVSATFLSSGSFHSIPLDDRHDSSHPLGGFGSGANHIGIPSAETVENGYDPKVESDQEAILKAAVIPAALPFQRWLSNLRRRKLSRDLKRSSYSRLTSDSDDGVGQPATLRQDARRPARHRKSASQTSSSGFVSAVRTATMTIADTSFASKSWVGSRLDHMRQSWTRRSIRTSQDSNTRNQDGFPDEKACLRAVQRRKILEELIESEESYVADLKVLVNVYFTLLTSVCALSTNTRASVRDNVTEILQMHEALLGDLHEIVPHSEYNQNQAKASPNVHIRGHVRWRSADSAYSGPRSSGISHKLRRSLGLGMPVHPSPIGIVADPKTAADVARVFEKFALQLFAYEEYGAKYEMMVRDLASTYKTLSSANAFEKGIEILSKTLESINARDEHSKKGLTFGDLVIKPIQRVCKYPLLFADLCKQTPVVDDPEAHAELEKVLFRLKEATQEINKATDDPKKRDLIEKTWLLQDRLRFPGQAYPCVLSRVLGHIQLCGVLHVAYQTRTSIQGQYMLCCLFKSCLVLAVGDKGLNSFGVVASIPLVNVSIEDADNGKGLQCHTAPFSWKLIFELDHRLFEIIISACNPIEEGQWRKCLNDRVCIETLDLAANHTAIQDICSWLTLDLKPIGTLFGQPQTLARRISIHRAATIGPKSQMSQVIVRNTHSIDHLDRHSSEASMALNRSQSVLSSGHVQILAPRRSERINMELALSDVWTKDVLPFPGMKQSENPFKASANHVMRKLSMASITSTLSKRTSSFVNFNKPDLRAPSPMDFSRSFSRSRTPSDIPDRPPQKIMQNKPKKSPPLTAVNFHKTPEMFLPPDFELKDPRISRLNNKKKTIRLVSDERPSSVQPAAACVNTKTSASKIRRSVAANVPALAPLEIPKAPAKLSKGANDGVSKVFPAGKDRPDVKENVWNAAGTAKPFAKQFRRFFN